MKLTADQYFLYDLRASDVQSLSYSAWWKTRVRVAGTGYRVLGTGYQRHQPTTDKRGLYFHVFLIRTTCLIGRF